MGNTTKLPRQDKMNTLDLVVKDVNMKEYIETNLVNMKNLGYSN